MDTTSLFSFYQKSAKHNNCYPFTGQIELTYKCNLGCVHCYAKGGLGAKGENELSTKEWKKIFTKIFKEGCARIILTGGEPLIREDFFELYSYLKKSGFIITIFTNGALFTKKIVEYFCKLPPYSFEITLNGITEDTYSSVTGVKGFHGKVIDTVKLLARNKLPLILKTNCLKQNKNEIIKIKNFAEELLGRSPEGNLYFKLDPMIYPRLNGDKESCNYRFSVEEHEALRLQDKDILKEYQDSLNCNSQFEKKVSNRLYICDSWKDQFFVNPYGRLKFCQFSDRFSVDLKESAFRKGFYINFAKISRQKFKGNSKCKKCPLRLFCYFCPAKSYLETGKQDGSVKYYCELAKRRYEDSVILKKGN